MEHRVRINFGGAALVLALGIAASVITSTAVASHAFRARARDAHRREQEISVKGSARTRVRSDLAVWHIEVRGEAKELQPAFEALDTGVGRVRAFLTERGFSASEVAIGPIDTATFYARDDKGRDTREVTGYALTRSFTVSTGSVGRAASAAAEVTQLLREGVKVASTRPAFYYTKLPDLKVQILGDASRDAKARADEIAHNSGSRVAEVRHAQMGVIQITEPNSTETSGGGMYDTSTIEKDVSVVTLTLGLG
jgi:hypothetical protein